MYTKEEIINRFKSVHGNKYDYSAVEYTRLTDKVTIICPIHGEFLQSPHAHLKGQGCPKCAIEKRTQEKRDTKNTFIEKSIKTHGNKYDYSKVYYKDSLTKVCIICPIHGEFLQRPDMHVSGYGCPKCGNKNKGSEKRLTKEEFINRSKTVHGDLYDYSKVNYVNNRTNVEIICKKHGSFMQEPCSHINGCGCPKCNYEKQSLRQTKTLNDFIKQANEVHNGRYSYNNAVYKDVKTKISITCPIHGDFLQIPSYHLSGCGCQKCGEELTISRGEIELRDFISSLVKPNDIIYNDRNVLNGSELDILIPSKNLAIEYDGLYWHSEIKKEKSYHLNKTNKCKENGIRLIHIFEDEWIYKNDICKSRVKNILGVSGNRIFARKCLVQKISSQDANNFINTNHLQGKVNSKINYGLFYNGELVSVMTFCNLRKNLGNKSNENSYELLRFANRLNTTVIGGADKLFKHFIREYNPKTVISYADKRWSDGNLYKKLNFEYIYDSKPNYFYIVNGKRKNRFCYRKDVLVNKYGCSKEDTEHNFCFKNKLYRIYDCGAMKFEYKKNGTH